MARKPATARKSKSAAADAGAPRPRKGGASPPSSAASRFATKLLPVLVVAFVAYVAVNRLYLRPSRSALGSYVTRTDVASRRRVDVPCYVQKKSAKGFVEGCHKVGAACGRAVRDGFVTPEEVAQLREIAEIGMANRSRLGGPTIMDVNTGFVKDGDGLVNIYQKDRSSPPVPRFTAEQFALYRSVIERIRLALVEEFQLEFLYFTAPTFITRLVGNASWSPTEIHDEYWHPHVDKDNTQHYDYSGLVYLSDYGVEFTGGLFAFLDKGREQVVEPARGRLMMFTAGKENLHQVRQVATGERFVMSMWFSCDARKQFRNFLDGKMHQHFKRDE
ncbi:hypothetical protein PybrP1_004354 [[Pythium] brassicae (nom. inval.)]|nr:hypothetical protein PybrP1_004354 [[Pythium] brassicae (nom. inval.)]